MGCGSRASRCIRQTGLVIASDQQGHYIPSTPLHIVRDRQFYGFLSDILPKEVYPAPIAAPLTWIPHDVNASAMSQVWMLESRMGPLDNGSCTSATTARSCSACCSTSSGRCRRRRS